MGDIYKTIYDNKQNITLDFVKKLFPERSDKTRARIYIELRGLVLSNKWSLVGIKGKLEPVLFVVENLTDNADMCKDALADIIKVSKQNQDSMDGYRSAYENWQQVTARGITLAKPEQPLLTPLGNFQCQVCQNIIQAGGNILTSAQMDQVINCVQNPPSSGAAQAATTRQPTTTSGGNSNSNMYYIIVAVILFIVCISVVVVSSMSLFFVGSRPRAAVYRNP
jgi:hypothetical protein